MKSVRSMVKAVTTACVVVSVGLLSSVPSVSAAPASSIPQAFPAGGTSDIGGLVFRDYNANGVMDPQEPGFNSVLNVDTVTVEAYDNTGALAGSATTNPDGTWIITGLNAGEPYRIELVGLPEYLEPGAAHAGGVSESHTSFAKAGDSDVLIAVNNPDDFCQSEDQTDLAVPCYIQGDAFQDGDAAGQDVFVTTDELQTTIKTHPATAEQIGSTWGVAYDTNRDVYYASTMLKRHTNYGVDGAGAIYTIDPTGTAAPVTFYNDASMTTDPRVLQANSADFSVDYEGWTLFGLRGYGDIEYYDELDRVYAVDLENKQIQMIDAASGQNVGNIPITPPTCVGDLDWMPWGLTINDNALYVATTCNHANSPTAVPEDMSSTIQMYDLAAGAYVNDIYSFSYGDYTKDHSDLYSAPPGKWEIHDRDGDGGYYRGAPVLMDVQFDNDESLIIGIGETSAYASKNTNSGSFESISGGDILRACFDYATGSYSPISDPTCDNSANEVPNVVADPTYGGVNSHGGLDDGPEFYIGDADGKTGHNERAMGSLEQIPGRENVHLTAMDPYNFVSGGLESYSNTTGEEPGGNADGLQLYGSSQNLFKSAGLGDLEASCMAAPLEIGNRVWLDLDYNGRQDPWNDLNGNGVYDGPVEDEVGLNGITLNLYDSTGTLVASAVTDVDGNYVFRGHTYDHPGAWTSTDPDPVAGDWAGIVPGGIIPGEDYTIAIDTTVGLNGEAANVINTATGIPMLVLADGREVALTLTDAFGTDHAGQDNSGDFTGTSHTNQYDKSDNDASVVNDTFVISTFHFNKDGSTADSVGQAGENDHTFDFGFWLPYDLALVKQLADGSNLAEVAPGDTVTFTLTVSNQLATDAANVGLVDYVPAGLTLADPNWTDNGDGSASLNTPIASLPGNSSVTVDIMFTVDADASGTLNNFAEISSFTDPEGNPVADIDSTPDGDPGDVGPSTGDEEGDDDVDGNGLEGGNEDDHDVATLVILPQYDLALVKQLADGSNLGQVAPGDTVTFTLTVSNQLATDAANVGLVDYVPAGLTLADPNWTDNGDGTATHVTGIASLPGNSSTTVDIMFTVDADASGTLNNFAEISSFTDPEGNPVEDVDSTPDSDQGDVGPLTGGDPDDDNVDGNGLIGEDEDDHDVASLNVAAPGVVYDLALIKQLADGSNLSSVSAGDSLDFVITVFNQGTEDASGIEVVDYLPAGLTLADADWTDNGDGTASLLYAGVLPAGDSVQVPITVMVDEGASGTLNNFAEISSFTDLEGNPVADVDSTPDGELGDVGPATGNDEGDDDIDGNGRDGGDEDDHDVASISIAAPGSILAKTGSSLSTILLWVAVAGSLFGLALLVLRRRVAADRS